MTAESRQFPLLLQRGDRIVAENRCYTVHSVDPWIEDRWGPFVNRVGVETSCGTYLTFPIGATIEVSASR